MLSALSLSCGNPEKEPFRPPDLFDINWTSIVTVIGDLEFPEGGAEGRFEWAQFQGFHYSVPPSAEVDISLKRVSGSADPVVILYGPRSQTGVWGSAIAADDDGGGGVDAHLRLGPLEGGPYLVVVTSREYPQDGDYRLDVWCRAGCDPTTMCPEPVGCDPDIICYTGYQVDEEGCPTCICNDECRTEEDCGPGQSCVRGICQEECRCFGPYEPVCGMDGVTYSSPCEAACVGVPVLSVGPCREDCEIPPPDCELECPFGYRLDPMGCPVCECRQACEACELAVDPVCTLNGRTYLNACLAECEGEIPAHVGPCLPYCPSLSECDTRCPDLYRRGENGCPLCECREQGCPEHFRVCGENGLTYADPCEAEQAAVPFLFEGHCPPFCHHDVECPEGYHCANGVFGLPPCDLDREDCLGLCLYRPGPCRRDEDCLEGDICGARDDCISPCHCPPTFEPVCGDNLIVYHNACRAFCSMVPPVRPGACCDPAELMGCDLDCPDYYELNESGCEVCACAAQPPCACNDDLVNETCGMDGQWYPNACRMRCHGVRPSPDVDRCREPAGQGGEP